MRYMVTLATSNGRDAVVTVIATNKQDAEYRAAAKAESTYGVSVTHVKRCLKAA